MRIHLQLHGSLKRRLATDFGGQKPRGQSLVEMALTLPILLMLLGGLVEFGFALNQYVNVVEAAREGARSGVDGSPDQSAGNTNFNPADPGNTVVIGTPPNARYAVNPNCDASQGTVTTNYYGAIACRVISSVRPVVLDPAKGDDIVITVVRAYQDPLCTPIPNVVDCSSKIMANPNGLWPWITPLPGTPPTPTSWSPGPLNIAGQWSLYGNSSSRFTRAKLQQFIDNNTAAASEGLLVVEVTHHYQFLLNLPWITSVLGTDELIFYTYTVVPLPAAEQRPTATNTPTPTPTFTPSPTRTNTPTATFTGTPLPSDTSTATPVAPTNTPSPTPTQPCRPGYVGAQASALSIPGNNPAWADGQMTMQVQLLLNDECGGAITDGRTVTLLTSRPATDTVTLNTRVGNTYYFNVTSPMVGASVFTATVDQRQPASGILLAIPGTTSATNTGNFVCVTGAPDISTSPNTFQILYFNPAPPFLNRRLVGLTVQWPTTSGLKVNSVSFGNSGNIIWNAGPASPPTLTINSAQWLSVNRAIVSGLYRPLQINFSAPITPGSGSWTYTVTATWDNSSGGSVCNSAPVTLTLP